MTAFATVALFRRNGQMTFRQPAKIVLDNLTQARKSAARLWQAAIKAPDKLARIVVVHGDAQRIGLSERTTAGRWTETFIPATVAAEQPHLLACLKELGIDPGTVPPPLPDVIEINGVLYRRDI